VLFGERDAGQQALGQEMQLSRLKYLANAPSHSSADARIYELSIAICTLFCLSLPN